MNRPHRGSASRTAPPSGGEQELGWQVDSWRGSAEVHHARLLPETPERAVWAHLVDAPALVLGSAQGEELVDLRLATTLGVDVVRRRSGGGVVMLIPGEVAWLDVILPAGDPLWDDDVSRSGLWLGEAWQIALADLGMTGTTVHRGALDCGTLGRLVCFGAVGPGEVTLDGRKVVGISQRRKRTAARFQCAVYRHWNPDLLARLLRLDAEAAEQLAGAAVGTDVPPDDLVQAFLAHLPR
jgi:lipoate-protein ligase A